MTDVNPVSITGTITITVLPQDNGHYICQMSPDLGDFSQENLQCYGQTKEHAIAIALEQLASEYRQMAQERQNIDWDTVERLDSLRANCQALSCHFALRTHCF
ncbi:MULTISPECIES: hypothetical protein [Brasilonema]|uniref:hypothetical protein n=1 Tax=Brasilonema TaxID=383614 RepID=UPI002006DBBB|nr:hypothetical protein [Brasilonema octagenarum]